MTTYTNPKALGLYAPVSNEKIKLSQEAEKAVAESLFTYKQLFYGLRLVAWRERDKRSIFFDALSNNELDQFKLAPGHRAEDGSYTKDEWDYNRLNGYLWTRFAESFDEAFNLEQVQSLKTIKDIHQATTELLEFALANWGEKLLGEAFNAEEDSVQPIGKGVTRCQLEVDGITIKGEFGQNKRTLILIAKGLPDVMVHQTKGDNSWKGGIHFDTFGELITLKSNQAQKFSKMLDLAAKLNLGIKKFMANPEGFLGLETAQAHQRNLQLIKEQLLIINRNHYEERKAKAKDQPKTRPINDVVDGEFDTDLDSDQPFAPEPQQSKLTRKQEREQEAQQWLADNPEFLEDVDAQLGLSNIDG
jgi:hypothetical protein